MPVFQKYTLLLPVLLFVHINCKKDETTGGNPKTPTLSIADAAGPEGNVNGVLSFTVTLSEASAANVLVNYATIAGSALAGQDFIAKTDGELLFAPGETQKTIDITIVGDGAKETDETFDVLLLNPVNATLARNQAKGTIQNDDQDNPFNIPTGGYTTPTSYPNKTLVWADEFNGATLSSDWTHETGNNQGWGNNELEYYRPENTTLFNGYLVIEAKQESFGGAAYTSSRMVTKGKKSFKYGRIDLRAALPEGQGIWPALWMLGDNIDQVNWPACGEIDIMELIGNQPDRVYGTAHYALANGQHDSRGSSKVLPGNEHFSDAFHVFSLEWEQDRIRWLIDDVPFHEVTPASMGAGVPYPFNNKFFFIFNLAVGGSWPGNPDATTVFPQRMIVDYVRVFQ